MTPLTDQQILTYRIWLYEGTARLRPNPDRPPGWHLLKVHAGGGWHTSREIAPDDYANLTAGLAPAGEEESV